MIKSPFEHLDPNVKDKHFASASYYLIINIIRCLDENTQVSIIALTEAFIENLERTDAPDNRENSICYATVLKHSCGKLGACFCKVLTQTGSKNTCISGVTMLFYSKS